VENYQNRPICDEYCVHSIQMLRRLQDRYDVHGKTHATTVMRRQIFMYL